VPKVDLAPLAELLQQRRIDVITFTSSSTVKNFARLFGGKDLAEVAAGSVIACIGPITAGTVQEMGGRADIVAGEFTVGGLLRALIAHFQTEPSGATDRRTGSAT
jgi:uroporphyrinogen III methyltransferase/synthase